MNPSLIYLLVSLVAKTQWAVNSGLNLLFSEGPVSFSPIEFGMENKDLKIAILWHL